MAGVLDFEIWVPTPVSAPVYSVHVTNSPAGPASAETQIELDGVEFQTLLAAVKADAPAAEARRQMGLKLFSVLFNGPVLAAWNQSLGRAQALPDTALRLRLWIDAPELAILPWELLYQNDYLAIAGNIFVSRFLPVSEPPAFVTPGKAKVLLVIQSPDEMPVDPALITALEASLAAGPYETPVKLINATLAEINAELSRGYEIVHYMGHGKDGKIFLVGDQAIKDGRDLATLFTGINGTQLIVLNVCYSGSTIQHGLISGLGPFLAQKSIPAVIAMQYDTIRQETAKAFNTSFYAALSNSQPVDRAVNGTRRAIKASAQSDARDWSTPILYMGTRRGNVLEFAKDEEEAAAKQLSRSVQQSAGAKKAIESFAMANDEIAAALGRIAQLSAARDPLTALLRATAECFAPLLRGDAITAQVRQTLTQAWNLLRPMLPIELSSESTSISNGLNLFHLNVQALTDDVNTLQTKLRQRQLEVEAEIAQAMQTARQATVRIQERLKLQLEN